MALAKEDVYEIEGVKVEPDSSFPSSLADIGCSLPDMGVSLADMGCSLPDMCVFPWRIWGVLSRIWAG